MILDEIAAKTRIRIQEQKKKVSLFQIREQAEQLPSDTEFLFEQTLRNDGLSLICEVKKASPSKGVIAVDFPYLDIAKEYEDAGAAAISCLTEPFYFQGCDRYLQEIASKAAIPVLRKDFTVDEYMIYEAKVMGASAVLLICAILDDKELQAYIELTHSLGLSALVEVHSGQEAERAMGCNSRIIGVNNRDLKTFEVDVNTSLCLRRLVPQEYLYVAESGIRTVEDMKQLKACGADAVLIGESLMRSPDKKQIIQEMRSI